jgi:hypothetical protein
MLADAFKQTFSEQKQMTEFTQEHGAPGLPKTKEQRLNTGQREAVEKAMVIVEAKNQGGLFDNMFLLSGKGGTGKTFCTEVLIDKIRKSFTGTISHVAPTWNAVNEILIASDDSSKTASTLASFLGTEQSEPDENGVQKFILKAIDFEKAKFLPEVFTADYIILDEASMIGGDGQAPSYQGPSLVSTDAWETIKFRLQQRKDELGTTPKKIILVGDYAQIPPVGTKPDHDALLIEKMMAKPETHHVLLENMRTNNEDLNVLHEKYRLNIDAARAAFKNGIPSNESIPRNPIPYDQRVDTKNISYIKSVDDAVGKYVKTFLQDPENVRNVVFINYNNENHANSQALTTKIREALFGTEARNEYNPGELILLKGNLASEIFIDGRNKSIIWHNETRFYVKEVLNDVTENINGLDFKGARLRLVTDFGKKRVEFTTFVPAKGEVQRVLGPYNRQRKGYVTEGGFVTYSQFKDKLEKRLPKMNYAYVVNSHKVQGSSYNHTFVDEGNILRSPETNKGFNNMMYTAVSRPKQTLTIFNPANPSTQSPNNSVPLQRQMVMTGDIWSTGMIPVIPTNLGGIHGAGLAQQAAAKGLVIKGEGDFSAKATRVAFPVKKIWSDQTDMDLLRASLERLGRVAIKNPQLKFALPLVGMGHGEGKMEEILPLLAATVKANPNITLVLPDASTHLGRPGTVRKDNTRENMPAIMDMLRKEGLIAPKADVDDVTANDIITDLINRGLVKTKC